MAKIPILTLVLFCFVALCFAQFNGLHVIRNTTLGQVLGSIDTPISGMTQVEKYFGIPYVKPPVGNLRFEEPEMMSTWAPDILETLKLHPACPQIDEAMYYITLHRVDFNYTDEDCLYLNVFVPVVNNFTRTFVPRGANDTNIPEGTTYGQTDPEPMAVLVYIHGGSNMVGTANMFDGDILAATGRIIVVTINYRLGVLGFLGTGGPDFPGNYGILDQIAALRWVQDNIALFNGDPRKVTVMGHSAASMDVGVLLMSPLAKGLFRAAICQSGAPSSVLTNRWPGRNSRQEVLTLGEHFNCTDITVKGVKECLKKIEVIPLTKSHPALGDPLFDAPTVETLQILSQRNISLHQYRWEWRSELFPWPEAIGVPHGADLYYLFGSPLRGHKLYNYTQNDIDMSYLMMQQWSHFVKFGSFEVNNSDWTTPPVAAENLLYDNTTKAYTRFYSANGRPAVGLGYNLKPREAKFWNSVIPDLNNTIYKTLSNWYPNPGKQTTTATPLNPTKDVGELSAQKNVFLILFIIFLVLSCLLLFLFLFICVTFCWKKNPTKYSIK